MTTFNRPRSRAQRLALLLLAGLWVGDRLVYGQVPNAPGVPVITVVTARGDRDPRVHVGPPVFNRPLPINTVTPKYTPAWFEAEQRVTQFKSEYGRIIVVINPKALASVSVGGFGIETAVWQTPMWSLAGNTNTELEWLYVEDLVALVQSMPAPATATPSSPSDAKAQAQIAAIREILAK